MLRQSGTGKSKTKVDEFQRFADAEGRKVKGASHRYRFLRYDASAAVPFSATPDKAVATLSISVQPRVEGLIMSVTLGSEVEIVAARHTILCGVVDDVASAMYVACGLALMD